ncbi:MAG TPA: chemotaxis protein CheW, partial [Nitrososphaera sp.]|nr:chemotaxis protein CheW [Nitrososphaera sp.]
MAVPPSPPLPSSSGLPAAASSQTQSEKRESTSFKIVVFKINIPEIKKKLDYAVSVDQVQEIGTVGSIARIPGAPSYVRGVMNLRGKIITIIDMKEKLGFDSIPCDMLQSSRILVAQVGAKLMGILVDEVDQVLEISSAEVENSSKVISADAKYIRGIAKHGERLIVILKLDELFDAGSEADKVQKQSGRLHKSVSGSRTSNSSPPGS